MSVGCHQALSDLVPDFLFCHRDPAADLAGFRSRGLTGYVVVLQANINLPEGSIQRIQDTSFEIFQVSIGISDGPPANQYVQIHALKLSVSLIIRSLFHHGISSTRGIGLI